MKRSAFIVVVVSLFASALVGCNSNGTDPSDSNVSQKEDDKDASGQTDMDKMKAELAKLSPEDAASAEKQHMCPVTDEMLGSMGAPEKVQVGDQDVWICCAGCKDTLLGDPDKYLAKLVK